MTPNDVIDGDRFAAALTSGIHRVLGQQDLLNRINVFPVADSDTGTNLSLSLGSALGVLRRDSEHHLGTLLAAVADALLDGARGNSGAIMAQFFQGMSDSAGEISRFTTYTFSKAVIAGSEYAHDALAEPREGTILSVIAAFARSVEQRVAGDADENFGDLFRSAVKQVEQALADTPKQLDVLRKAGVVDAGAKGFAELVGGVADFLHSGEIEPMPDIDLSEEFEAPVDFAEADNDSQYRFCTECLVTGDDIDRRKLREALAPLGDSFVLAGSKRKAKIHIHVNDPDTVFTTAAGFGEVVGQKADDMHRQQHSTHEGGRRFAVITDSAADITDDDMERLDIHMVPCRIQFGDRGYLDKVSITTDEFYEKLRTNPNHPTTSQPAPGDFRRQFQFLASHFPNVLSINLTSQASGTWQAAVSASERIRAHGKVHVIDSLTASVAQGQLAVLAGECADAGLSIEETKKIVEERVEQVRIYAALRDLKYAVRGGRLPGWVKVIADLLHLSPVITIGTEGKVGLAGFLFGRNNLGAAFARFVKKRVDLDRPIDVAVAHAVSPDDVNELAREARSGMSNIVKLDVCELGTGLGTHGGPGTLIFSAMPSISTESFAVRDD